MSEVLQLVPPQSRDVVDVEGDDARAIGDALRALQLAKMAVTEAERAAREVVNDVGKRIVPDFAPEKWGFDAVGRFFHKLQG